METLHDILNLWGQHQARHAMLVHMPIVLSMVCAVVALISAIRGGRVASLRWMTLVLGAALVGSAFAATATGDLARETAEDAISAAGQKVLHEHEELADSIWAIAAGGVVLTAIGFLGSRRKPVVSDAESKPVTAPKPHWIRPVSTWLAAIVFLAAAGWAGLTGHEGGKLVYEYGAVVPTKAEAVQESTQSDDPRVTFFQERAYPILRDNCMRCHNPRKLERVNNLNQTTIAGLLKGGDSGPALVPGRPEESLMVHRIRYEDEDSGMPPSGKLADSDIAAIEKWILEGAVWEVPNGAAAHPKRDEGAGDD